MYIARHQSGLVFTLFNLELFVASFLLIHREVRTPNFSRLKHGILPVHSRTTVFEGVSRLDPFGKRRHSGVMSSEYVNDGQTLRG